MKKPGSKFIFHIIIALLPLCCYSQNVGEWKTYGDRKLGFSFDYPSYLNVYAYADGASAESNDEDGRNLFTVVNDGSRSYGVTIKYFFYLRKLKVGKMVKGNPVVSSTKIENLRINGFPAVKVIQIQASRDDYASTNGCKAPDPISLITVYVFRNGRIRQLNTIQLFGGEIHQRRNEQFEAILTTFRFSTAKPRNARRKRADSR